MAMQFKRSEDIHRIYADIDGVPCKIEVDYKKQMFEMDYDYLADDDRRRSFAAYACVNGDPERFCLNEYANSDHDANWNCDVCVSYYGNLNTDDDILDLIENLLTNFFEVEKAMDAYNKLKNSELVK